MQFIPGDIIQASADGLAFSNAAEMYSASRPYLYSVDAMASNRFGSLAASALAISPDKTLLVVGSNSSPRAHIYDASTGALATTLSNVPTGQVNGIAFSADQSRLACAHATSPYVTIYNTADWSKVADPTVLPPSTGNACAFNPAGTLLAVAHNSSPYVTIYNTGDWSKVADPATLLSNSGLSVDFNFDGTLMAVTAGTGDRLIVYNTSGWTTVSLSTSPPNISSPKCRFSPNGAYLAYYGANLNRLYIYDASTWTTLTISNVGGTVGAATWLDNAHIAINTDGLIRVINVQTNTVVNTHMAISNAGINQMNAMVCMPASPKTLSGTVRDIDENGLSRLVTAIHAATGRRVASANSAAVTGIFSMTVWGDDQHNVICDGQSLEVSQIVDAIPE